MSGGADSARKRTLWGSSALEMGDHRLLEDGGERSGALGSDVIVPETAKGWVGAVREQACQRALTQEQTLPRGWRLTPVW